MSYIAIQSPGDCDLGTRCAVQTRRGALISTPIPRRDRRLSLNAKVGHTHTHARFEMKNIIGNYLRIHRKRTGLSQRDLGVILGYENEWQVSRHERSKAVPPLLVALAYEAIFGEPVSAIFAGFRLSAADMIEMNLESFKTEMARRLDARVGSKTEIQKLQWLEQRVSR